LFDERVDRSNRIGISNEFSVRTAVLKLAAQYLIFAFGGAEFEGGIDHLRQFSTLNTSYWE
jgi:hypothetical protein